MKVRVKALINKSNKKKMCFLQIFRTSLANSKTIIPNESSKREHEKQRRQYSLQVHHNARLFPYARRSTANRHQKAPSRNSKKRSPADQQGLKATKTPNRRARFTIYRQRTVATKNIPRKHRLKVNARVDRRNYTLVGQNVSKCNKQINITAILALFRINKCNSHAKFQLLKLLTTKVKPQRKNKISKNAKALVFRSNSEFN